MTGAGIRAGGILAAGEGSRLRQDGWTMAKPLVPVEGVPLIEKVIGNFLAAGVENLAIIFNAREEDCARFVRSRFPDTSIEILVKTTASSYESFREVTAMLPPGPALFSTVDAWCSREDFAEFARKASRAPAEETVLAVTPFVSDEKPLWVRLDPEVRIREIGGDSGDAVTAGIYLFSQRARTLPAPSTIGRLREYLAWLVEQGETVRGISIETVVDVDRSEDIRIAEALARGYSPVLGKTMNAQEARSWGIYRELAHSPGRETDDARILEATARRLESKGFHVTLKTAEEVGTAAEEPPPFLFVMCERLEILSLLDRWQQKGICQVNSASAIRNTYRDRMLPLFEVNRVPFPASVLVPTALPIPPEKAFRDSPTGCWVKRGDVHSTQAGDVVFAPDPESLALALATLAGRGIERALLQEHVPGDLIKFYGVGDVGQSGTPDEMEPGGWFQWFYHRDQRLENHPFDPKDLAAAAWRAAASLGLEVYGGDAIAARDGRLVVIDLNAWPSFALYRDAASERIASYLAARFRRHAAIGVPE